MNIGGMACDTYCLSALDSQSLYAIGEGRLASGSAIKDSWQAVTNPNADYSIWRSQWSNPRSVAGAIELKKDQFRHDVAALSPESGASLGAWQWHQGRLSYFSLNYDYQGAWERSAFEYSQEVGGHDLGMAWSGEDYLERQLSDAARLDLAATGSKKMFSKATEYAGAATLLGGLRTVSAPRLVDADVLNWALKNDESALRAIRLLGSEGRVTGRTVAEVMKGGVSRAEVRAFMKANGLKFTQSNFAAGKEAAKLLGRDFERTSGHFSDLMQLGTARAKGLGFVTYRDGRAINGAIRLGLDAKVVNPSPGTINKIKGAIDQMKLGTQPEDYFLSPPKP
jgi:hypothetical protein